MISLTIDGNEVTVPKGTTILEAARKVGIAIPTLCWLEKVSPTGACRVCAVEVAGVDRTMTACNTPVKEGIVVTTRSPRLTEIRKKVMELMLVNHPLDCPVCDAAGECGLQDACYGLNVAKQEYSALLERRPIRYDWRLLESDPNRCILCEKCVKVDHEIVGCDAIAVVNKGEATIVDTVDGGPLNCEFCGNCIAACPTGTLISKPFKFKGRPWTFTVTKSVCAFCSTGCQIEYHVKDGRVERVTSEDDTYNSGTLCINGRFGYRYLATPGRLTVPLVDGAPAGWDDALALVAGKVQSLGSAMAGIASPRLSNEENFLFAKLLRAIGSTAITSEATLGYAQAQKLLGNMLGLSGASARIDRIDSADAILVLGTDLNAESTGVEYRVIKAATKNDAKLVLATTRGVKLKKFANCHLQYRPGGEVALVTGIMKALSEAGLENAAFVDACSANGAEFRAQLAGITLADCAVRAGVAETDLVAAAELLGGGKQIAIVFGAEIIRCADAAAAVASVGNLALLTGCLGNGAGGLFPLHDKNNTQGMLDMGASTADLWEVVAGIEQGTIRGLYVAGANPLVAFPDSGRIRAALKKLELLVVQDIAASELTGMAHVVLPAAAAAEKEGTFTTPDNRVQCLQRATTPPGEARPDLVVFGDLLGRVTGAGGVSSAAAVMAEIKAAVSSYGGTCAVKDGRCSGTVKAGYALPSGKLSFAMVELSAAPQDGLSLLVGPIGYHNGTGTTLSENNLLVAPAGYLELSAKDAGRLGIADGDSVTVTSPQGSVTGPARVSGGMPAGLIFAPGHFRELNANALLSGRSNTVAVTVAKA